LGDDASSSRNNREKSKGAKPGHIGFTSHVKPTASLMLYEEKALGRTEPNRLSPRLLLTSIKLIRIKQWEGRTQ